MKDEDMLLYGGIALAAYFLFIKKPGATAPVTVLPTSSAGLISPTQPVAAGQSTLVSNISSALSNLFGGSSGTPNPANNIQTSTPGGETFTSTGTPAPIVTATPTDPNLFSGGVPQLTMPAGDLPTDQDFESTWDEENNAISGMGYKSYV